MDSSNKLYVLDTGNNRVVIYDASGAVGTTPTYLTQWAPSIVGQLNNPSAIAVDSTGTNVYIADTDNNRVQKCTSDGVTCVAYGSLGSANGKFSGPKGIAYDPTSSTILVADTGNNRVQEISATDGTWIRTIGQYGSSAGQFTTPTRVATDTSGNIYVLDALNRIQKFNILRSATLLWTLPTSGASMKIHTNTMYITELPTTMQTYNTVGGGALSTLTNDVGHPVDMTLDSSGNFYINNNFTPNPAPTPGVPVIQKFSSQFVQLNEWRKTPDFAYTSQGPMGIGANSGNDIYIANTDANSIEKINSLGNFVTPYPVSPTPGALSGPMDVATETTGKYTVADTGNHRIVKYDPVGNFVCSAFLPSPTPGGPTPLPNSTASPYGVTIDSTNKIYVADAGYHRIQRFDGNCVFETSWGMFGSADSSLLWPNIPQFDTPEGMAIDTSGFIYVADMRNSRIQRFNQNGDLSTGYAKWGAYGTQDGNFVQPRNVAVDANTRIFVSEVGNRRIQAFGDATASAGLGIVQTGGVLLKEGTDSASMTVDSYTVQLTTQPSTIPTDSTVYVDVSVSDPTQATVQTPTLVFTPQNWNIPQVETVVPIHDFVSSGTHTVVIYHKPRSATDVHYQKLAIETRQAWADNFPVTATIEDIDVPGVTFSTNTVPLATEGAQLSNAYTVVLNTKPANNSVVTIALTPDASFLAISPTSMVFTATDGDWNSPRAVHILPLHDNIVNVTNPHVGNINHTVTSTTDPNYQLPLVTFSGGSGNVAVNISDIDHVGVTLSKSTVNVTENGASDSYTVRLTSKPYNDVQLYLQDASASAQVSISPSSLTFNSSNWDQTQTVTVDAIHDFIKNPINPRSTVINTTVSSGDPAYNALAVSNVTANITDTDTTTLLLYTPDGTNLKATEGGATGTYLMQLTSQPSATVTATLSSPDNQATTSAYIYTFTPSNWDTPQYATVSAIDDALAQGTHTGNILHTLVSSDANFNGKTATITVTITDNDTPGIVLTLPNGTINIAEAGPTDTYFVRLGSQPTANVTLNFNGVNQATASPYILNFDSTNWNVDQTVNIAAIQDYIVEGQMTATMTYTAVSTDLNYNGKTASFVANISDDDTLSPGLTIVETNGSTEVTQGGANDTYTIALGSKPTANVKVKIISDNTYATTSAGLFWFTPAIWNIPQTVTVITKPGPSVSGSATTIFTHLVMSTDPHYDGLTAPTVNVTVHENNSASAASAADAKPPICGKTPPNSAPNLFQVNTMQTQATLYFAPIRDNISYYFIAYGFAPGDFRFGTSFQMGPYDGVIDYTINMLTPGTKYYFTVRGGNGCAPGPWSAAVPATTVSSAGSSTATQVYYAPVTQTTSSSSSGSSGSGLVLTRNLYPGSRGADVRALQQYLNTKGFLVAQSGAGSPGNETDYYGSLTAAAVRRFQEAHFQEILSPLGYASGTGIVGPSTRGYISSHP